MQITGVTNISDIKNKRNFKGGSANTSSFSDFPSYQSISLEASKAYALPQITEGYREIKTFDVPYIGQGKLYELANGHKIITLPKAGKTYITTIVGAGFLDEPADKKYMAHLTEHLLARDLFLDANHPTKKFLMRKAAIANADTDNSSTSYYISADVENRDDLDELLKIQFATISNKDFSEGTVEQEKTTLVQEVREKKYFEKEGKILYAQTLKNLFGLDKYNGMAAENTFQKIETISKADLEKFYQDFYRPDNMTTIIIGNVDNTSIGVIKKYFNKMPKPQSEIQRSNTSSISPATYIKQTTRTDLNSQNEYGYWDYATLAFIGPQTTNTIDTENIIVMSEIIKKRLDQKKIDINFKISSTTVNKEVPQVIQFTLFDSRDKLDDGVQALYSIISDLAKTPPTKEELSTIKDNVKQTMLSDMEMNYSLATTLYDKLCANAMNNKYLFGDLTNISQNSIQNAAKKYLDLTKASLSITHSDNEKIQNDTKVSFKGSVAATNKDSITEYDLPNNMHVIIDSRPGIINPSASFQLLYEDKARLNPGIIDAMSSSLIQKNDVLHWDWIEQNGIWSRRTGLFENIETMIKDLMAKIEKPEFDAEKLENAKKSQNNYLKRYDYEFSPWIKSMKMLDYKNTVDYRLGTCPYNMTTDGLKAYYANLLRNSQGTFIITIAPDKLDQVKSEINAWLSEFPMLKPQDFSKLSRTDSPSNLGKNYIVTKEYDSSDDITIEKKLKIVHNGNTKDEAGILILNEILREKLQNTLRTNSRLTYAAIPRYETYSPNHGVLNIYMLMAQVPLTENTRTALDKMDKVINDVTSIKPDDDMLNCIKKQVKSNLLTPGETSRERNMQLESNCKEAHDLYHLQKVAASIDRISADDLQKIAQKYLTRPYILEVSGNKTAIEANKKYFSTLGEKI